MYPLEHLYSIKAYEEWQNWKSAGSNSKLKDFKQSSCEVRDDLDWEIASWDELRTAISFLTLMNKRHVLYFRGQKEYYDLCLPTLFREEWSFKGRNISLTEDNQVKFYTKLLEFRTSVLKVAEKTGTPRSHILKHVPAAAASILQHYELWPTYFIDVTRSLSIATAFAEGQGKDRDLAYLFVFAMPDLRGSITSDMDQHVSISRLEAICPPDAIRPHHQNAYLVARFPEPPNITDCKDSTWKTWRRNMDLMKRLVAKFVLKLENGKLSGAPFIDFNFLFPPGGKDMFGKLLYDTLEPKIIDFIECELSINRDRPRLNRK
ncbi:MAG: FRG domain-containing protein [Pseudomonadales bacterium]